VFSCTLLERRACLFARYFRVKYCIQLPVPVSEKFAETAVFFCLAVRFWLAEGLHLQSVKMARKIAPIWVPLASLLWVLATSLKGCATIRRARWTDCRRSWANVIETRPHAKSCHVFPTWTVVAKPAWVRLKWSKIAQHPPRLCFHSRSNKI